MNFPVRFAFMALAALLLSLTGAGCVHSSKRVPSAISVVNATEPEGVRVTQTGANVLIEIHNPRGIGSARFEVAGRPPVAEVRVRLHLRGLEEFRFAQGGSQLRLAVSSQAGHAVRQSVQRDGQREVQITPHDLLWSEVRIVPGPDTPSTIPLASGCFEITLPAVLTFGEGADFRLSWVDFFR